MKKLNINDKFLALGAVLVVAFNPLAVNLWADALTTALEYIKTGLVNVSMYTVIVGVTLFAVGLILKRATRETKQTAKVKKSKGGKDGLDYEDLK